MDIQGHRGCRGLYPENTIPAFINAIDLGVDTLEMDAVVSKDGLTIISHEPFMSHEICRTPENLPITSNHEQNHNIYQLTYEEIKSYDCGSSFVDRFPQQKKLSVHKPSLLDMAYAVKTKLVEVGLPHINYNIEIKRKPQWDFSHHPPYTEFADIVINDIMSAGIMDTTTVQCFDIATLQYIHRKYPEVRLVYLVEEKGKPEANIGKLGFIPHIYSPLFKLVNKALVDYCVSQQLQLIPWTVNEEQDIRTMIDLGVAGIISDYPDRVIKMVLSDK